MKDIATSVRITARASSVLSGLTSKSGKSKAQIVEEALEQWEDKLFWAEVQSAFAEPEPDDLRVERELWDRTVGDGLDETR